MYQHEILYVFEYCVFIPYIDGTSHVKSHKQQKPDSSKMPSELEDKGAAIFCYDYIIILRTCAVFSLIISSF